jgi:hypothetical protein
MLSGHDAADALEEEVGRGGLEDDAAAPSWSAFTISAFSMAAVSMIVRTGVGAAASSARASMPETPGMARSRKQDVRLEVAGQPHRLVAVRGFRHDDEPVFGLEKGAETLAEDRVIVRDEDADAFRSAHGARPVRWP